MEWLCRTTNPSSKTNAWMQVPVGLHVRSHSSTVRVLGLPHPCTQPDIEYQWWRQSHNLGKQIRIARFSHAPTLPPQEGERLSYTRAPLAPNRPAPDVRQKLPLEGPGFAPAGGVSGLHEAPFSEHKTAPRGRRIPPPAEAKRGPCEWRGRAPMRRHFFPRNWTPQGRPISPLMGPPLGPARWRDPAP